MYPNMPFEFESPPEHVKRTAGSFNASEWPVYFIATIYEYAKTVSNIHSDFLMAVSEIGDELDTLENICFAGGKLLLDSGIRNLATEHLHTHADEGMTMAQVLALPPEEVHGFDKLYKSYTDVVERLGSIAWGYTEFNQGGCDEKKRFRSLLEAEGYAPIPVYEPLSDGWDYFDELASEYDRICLGSVAYTDRSDRLKLIATAFERRRKYPYCWIHLSGVGANEWLNAYPLSSCDSSSWLGLRRWGEASEYSMNKRLSPLMPGVSAAVKEGEKGSQELSDRISAMQHYMLLRNWRNHLGDLQELGFDLCSKASRHILRGGAA